MRRLIAALIVALSMALPAGAGAEFHFESREPSFDSAGMQRLKTSASAEVTIECAAATINSFAWPGLWFETLHFEPKFANCGPFLARDGDTAEHLGFHVD